MCIKNKMEAILLLGGDEVKIKDLAKHFSISIEEATNLLRELRIDRRNTGINLEINGEFVNLTTNPIYGSEVNSYFEHEWHPRKLSAVALETLSIIAYKQPVTKSEIEAIRHVNSVDGIIFSLREKQFIRVCGKKKAVGSPSLYEITDKFLGYLGISSIEELPNYQEVKNGSIYDQFKNLSDAMISSSKETDPISSDNDDAADQDHKNETDAADQKIEEDDEENSEG